MPFIVPVARVTVPVASPKRKPCCTGTSRIVVVTLMSESPIPMEKCTKCGCTAMAGYLDRGLCNYCAKKKQDAYLDRFCPTCGQEYEDCDDGNDTGYLDCVPEY